MTPAKMRIYEQLFDAIIERDKVFGGLLRKVKSAYSAYLATPHATDAREPAGGRSDAAQTENAELKAENATLKDLVERLHRELQLNRSLEGASFPNNIEGKPPPPAHVQPTPPRLDVHLDREPGHPASPSPIRQEDSGGAAWPLESARSESSQNLAPDGPGRVVEASQRPFERPKSVPSLDLKQVQQMAVASAQSEDSDSQAYGLSARSLQSSLG
jgi:hypothetical protein